MDLLHQPDPQQKQRLRQCKDDKWQRKAQQQRPEREYERAIKPLSASWPLGTRRATELIHVVNVNLGQPLAVWLFFENTDGIPSHLRHFTVVLNLINRPAASLISIFTVTLDTGDFYGEIFPVSSLEQVGPELSDGFRAIDRLHARRH
jgi:hypothetical protein